MHKKQVKIDKKNWDKYCQQSLEFLYSFSELPYFLISFLTKCHIVKEEMNKFSESIVKVWAYKEQGKERFFFCFFQISWITTK